MAAAGAALLRSANKMARTPPRLASALERQGRLLTSSRFSTSSGSTPRVSQTDSKKVLNANEWDRVKTAAIEATTACAFFTVVGGIFVICGWVNPRLDRINANLEASNRLDVEIMDEVKRGHQRIREQWGSSQS